MKHGLSRAGDLVVVHISCLFALIDSLVSKRSIRHIFSASNQGISALYIHPKHHLPTLLASSICLRDLRL